jgi:hypothetical protein
MENLSNTKNCRNFTFFLQMTRAISVTSDNAGTALEQVNQSGPEAYDRPIAAALIISAMRYLKNRLKVRYMLLCEKHHFHFCRTVE